MDPIGETPPNFNTLPNAGKKGKLNSHEIEKVDSSSSNSVSSPELTGVALRISNLMVRWVDCLKHSTNEAVPNLDTHKVTAFQRFISKLIGLVASIAARVKLIRSEDLNKVIKGPLEETARFVGSSIKPEIFCSIATKIADSMISQYKADVAKKDEESPKRLEEGFGMLYNKLTELHKENKLNLWQYISTLERLIKKLNAVNVTLSELKNMTPLFELALDECLKKIEELTKELPVAQPNSLQAQELRMFLEKLQSSDLPAEAKSKLIENAFNKAIILCDKNKLDGGDANSLFLPYIDTIMNERIKNWKPGRPGIKFEYNMGEAFEQTPSFLKIVSNEEKPAFNEDYIAQAKKDSERWKITIKNESFGAQPLENQDIFIQKLVPKKYQRPDVTEAIMRSLNQGNLNITSEFAHNLGIGPKTGEFEIKVDLQYKEEQNPCIEVEYRCSGENKDSTQNDYFIQYYSPRNGQTELENPLMMNGASLRARQEATVKLRIDLDNPSQSPKVVLAETTLEFLGAPKAEKAYEARK